MLIRTYICPT